MSHPSYSGEPAFTITEHAPSITDPDPTLVLTDSIRRALALGPVRPAGVTPPAADQPTEVLWSYNGPSEPTTTEMLALPSPGAALGAPAPGLGERLRAVKSLILGDVVEGESMIPREAVFNGDNSDEERVKSNRRPTAVVDPAKLAAQPSAADLAAARAQTQRLNGAYRTRSEGAGAADIARVMAAVTHRLRRGQQLEPLPPRQPSVDSLPTNSRLPMQPVSQDATTAVWGARPNWDR